MPVTYAVVTWCKRVEGAKVFDGVEDYSPFAIGEQNGEVRYARDQLHQKGDHC